MAPTAHPMRPRARTNGAGGRRTFLRTVLAAIAAVGTFLSLAVVASPADAARIRRTATELDYSHAVLSVLNAERSAHGLRPLRGDSRLRLSARWHNLAMARANQ